jgi:hypothetical protein
LASSVWPYQPSDPVAGEAKGWELTAAAEPAAAERRALVEYDPSTGRIAIASLGQAFVLDVPARLIGGVTPVAETLLDRLGYVLRPALVFYAALAKAIEPAGRLVLPMELAGGDVFIRGSHQLPLDDLAARFQDGADAVAERALLLGGQEAQLADAAFRFWPLPRIPVTIAYWFGDDEFEPRSSLMFDATAEEHLPIDLLWGLATYTAMAQLIDL